MAWRTRFSASQSTYTILCCVQHAYLLCMCNVENGKFHMTCGIGGDICSKLIGGCCCCCFFLLCNAIYRYLNWVEFSFIASFVYKCIWRMFLLLFVSNAGVTHYDIFNSMNENIFNDYFFFVGVSLTIEMKNRKMQTYWT